MTAEIAPSPFAVAPVEHDDFEVMQSFTPFNGGDLTSASVEDHWPTKDPDTIRRRYLWSLARQQALRNDPAVRMIKAVEAASGEIVATALFHVYPDGPPKPPMPAPPPRRPGSTRSRSSRSVPRRHDSSDSACVPASASPAMITPPVSVNGHNSTNGSDDEGEEDLETMRRRRGGFPAGFPVSLWEYSMQKLYAQRRDWMGPGRAWVLTQVQTREGWRCRGAGSALVKWGLEQARFEHAPVYSEARPGVVQLYEKLGFQGVGSSHIVDRTRFGLDGEVIFVRMVAPPKPVV